MADDTGLTEVVVAEGASNAAPPRRARRSTSDTNAPRTAFAASLLTVTLWSSAFVGIRSAGRALSPGALTLGRLLVGAVVLGAMLGVRGERLPGLRDLRPVAFPLLLCGALWFRGYNLALNAAEHRVDAGTAAMLVNIGPILIAVLAGVLLREGFPPSLLVGCAIAFAGVVVIGLATSGHGTSTTGVALCLIAGCAYAGGVVSQKPVLRSISPLPTTFLCCVIGVAICLPFAPSLVRQLNTAGPSAIAWTVYLGAFPTALAFTTWAFALARTNAGRLAAMTYLVPPLSVVLGWALLGETPPLLALAGGALCLTGVVVSRRRPPLRRRLRPDEQPVRRG